MYFSLFKRVCYWESIVNSLSNSELSVKFTATLKDVILMKVDKKIVLFVCSCNRLHRG